MSDFGKAEIINEVFDYGQGYQEIRFGFKLGNRIWFVGIEGYGHDNNLAQENRQMCAMIVERWNKEENKDN